MPVGSPGRVAACRSTLPTSQQIAASSRCEYRGSTDPERILIGETQIVVEMGDGELTAPDGETNYRNYRGSIVRRTVYDAAGDFLEREIFKANGDVDRYVFGDSENGRSIAHYLNGEAVSYKELDDQGRLSYMKWADGREQFWDRSRGEELFLTLYPDGRERLVERLPNGGGSSKVEDPMIIANTIEILTQTKK
jgi:hypothetical protein